MQYVPLVYFLAVVKSFIMDHPNGMEHGGKLFIFHWIHKNFYDFLSIISTLELHNVGVLVLRVLLDHQGF